MSASKAANEIEKWNGREKCHDARARAQQVLETAAFGHVLVGYGG